MEHSHHLVAATGSGAIGVIAALFLTGLVGGLGHCSTMCGAFVLMQLDSEPRGSFVRRLAGWALLPFQLGRMTSYAALGAAAGSFGAALVKTTGVRWALAGFLLIAAGLFLLHGFKLLRPGGFSSRIGEGIARAAGPLLRAPKRVRGYALGAMLGLLPCGFLYGAVVASAAAGGPLEGALAMAGFAAGTSASLLAVGVAGRAAATRWRRVSAHLAGPVFLANAGLAAVLAVRTVLGA